LLKVAVLGAGSWGTALAQVAAENNIITSMWARRKELADDIKKLGENPRYLPGAKISRDIMVSDDLEKVVANSDVLILAVPSQAIRATVRKIKSFLKPDTVIVSAAKGVERESFQRMSQVLEEELPQSFSNNIAVISGPSHAEEVVARQPTAIVSASATKQVAEKVREVLMNGFFRVYTNTDIVGVELGGALKNIIALCAGICDGLGLGDNSRAALITRGIVEITRLGVELGASPATFFGLSGVGDLIVTCDSMHSRNRRAGIEIGRGKTVEQVIAASKMVIEGINTTEATFLLAQKLNIDMPITKQAYQVLFQEKPPMEAVNELMGRVGKHEYEDILIGDYFKS